VEGEKNPVYSIGESKKLIKTKIGRDNALKAALGGGGTTMLGWTEKKKHSSE